MYSIILNTNAIIRPKENGIHSRGCLCSSQTSNAGIFTELGISIRWSLCTGPSNVLSTTHSLKPNIQFRSGS